MRAHTTRRLLQGLTVSYRLAGAGGAGRAGPATRGLHASVSASVSTAASTSSPTTTTSLLTHHHRHHRSAALNIALAAAAAAATGAAGYAWAGQRHSTPEGSPPAPPAGSIAAAPQSGAAPAAPAVDRAALLADLRTWLVSNGADVEAIDIRPCSENSAGVGVFATPAAPARSRRGLLRTLADWAAWRSPDVVLASFPLSLAVTPAAALADPALGAAYGRLLASGAADERALVMLFLAVERAKGRASSWAPWLAALPREFGTPLYFSAADRALLAGTALGRAVSVLAARLEAAWARLAPEAARLASAAGLAAPPTLADFTWAYSVFWSRGMAFPAPAPTMASGEAVAGADHPPHHRPPSAAAVVAQEGILPGLDFCNHAPGAPVRWTVYGAPTEDGGATAGDALPSSHPTHAALVAPRWGVPRPGAEVLIDYGGKSQEELLLLYGFAHASVEAGDVLMVACPLPASGSGEGAGGAGNGMAWDDDLRARVSLLRARGLTPQVFLPALPAGGLKTGHKHGVASLRRSNRRVDLACPGASLPLPPGVWETLEAFVLEPAAVASAAADPDGAPPKRASEADARGLRMAVLTTLTRLLEAAVVGLEGPGGTGPLEADVAALAAHEAGGPRPPGTPDLAASPHAPACVAYRATQKRIARDWLAEARGLLAAEMAELERLVGLEGGGQ